MLEDVDVNLELCLADGTKPSRRKFWAAWQPGEEKSLPLDESQAPVEKIHLTGTARRGFEREKLDVELFSRSHSEAISTVPPKVGAAPKVKNGEVRLTPLLEDPAAVPALIKVLSTGDTEHRQHAALILLRSGRTPDPQ